MKIKAILIILSGITVLCYLPAMAQELEERVSFEMINDPRLLQGEWIAYKVGINKGEFLIIMELKEPKYLQVNNQTYRSSLESRFENFELIGNLLLTKAISKTDTAYVYRLTTDELTINWGSKDSQARILYEKKR